MKRIILFLLALGAMQGVFGQDITGEWNGKLEVMGKQLHIVFHIDRQENAWSVTMDSPDQNAYGIPASAVTVTDSKLNVRIANIGIEYTGELTGDKIIGVFKQVGQSFPLDLSREKIEKAVLNRPQEPVKPYPYYSEDVIFSNPAANITLAGTLTLPKKEGIFPVVVLITGSGPQNRDEELMDHKPFLIIADYLTRNGIAVLRYDDRGVGQSTGVFAEATTEDFASDAESAVAYLKTRKEVNPKQIGLIGHSEGGIVAPMIAARSKDIAFIVMLAGTGIPGDKLLLLQIEAIAKASRVEESDRQQEERINQKVLDIVLKSKDTAQLKSDLTAYLKQVVSEIPDEKSKEIYNEDFVKASVERMANPWMQYFIKYNPAPVLEKVKCPVLAMNGEKDLQVPAEINLEAIGQALAKGGNKRVTIKSFPGLNHLFQECETGLLAEYAKIEQTFSPVALDFMTQWILSKR